MAVAIGLGGGLWTAVIGVISTLPFFARQACDPVLRIMSAASSTPPRAWAPRRPSCSPGMSPHAASTMLVQCAASSATPSSPLPVSALSALAPRCQQRNGADHRRHEVCPYRPMVAHRLSRPRHPRRRGAANLLADGLSATMEGRHARRIAASRLATSLIALLGAAVRLHRAAGRCPRRCRPASCSVRSPRTR